MAATPNLYVLILCGGTGPRLWPLSRVSHPKQFLKLFGGHSLLQQTFARYQKIVPTNHIFVVTQSKYRSQILADLPNLSPTNLLAEPQKKNTAMAIIYGAAVVKKLDSNAVIISAPADHFIAKNDQFSQDIHQAVTLATTTTDLVTIGIKPTFPNPGFGYLTKNHQFIEKPSVSEARTLIKRGALWNSGIYIFSLSTLETELSTHQPKYFSLYKKLSTGRPNLVQVYQQSPDLAFDFAISEKTRHHSTVSCHFDWSDVGEWPSIWNKLVSLKNGHRTISSDTLFTDINSKNCLISGQKNKLIGLVGLNQMAIIDTPDALLVCDMHDSFSVRDLVGTIAKSHKLKKYFLK